MKTLYLKSALEDKRLLTETKGGVQGKVSEAVANLTMFSKDCDDDLVAIEINVQQTQDELKKRSNLTLKQDAEIRRKKAELDSLNVRLEAMSRQL